MLVETRETPLQPCSANSLSLWLLFRHKQPFWLNRYLMISKLGYLVPSSIALNWSLQCHHTPPQLEVMIEQPRRRLLKSHWYTNGYKSHTYTIILTAILVILHSCHNSTMNINGKKFEWCSMSNNCHKDNCMCWLILIHSFWVYGQ